MTVTALAGDVQSPAAGRPDAPTARLVLPASASEEEWHAIRQTGLGGSDIAGILGMNPRWSSPLRVWREKHGHRDDGDSEAAECGREMEPVIARLFSRRTGLEVAVPPGTLAHMEHRWMLANVDRYVLDGAGAVRAPLECKNRSEHQWPDWEEGTPDGPALQAHWYMAVGGWDHAWVAAMVGGNRLRWHRLERDEELIAHLVDFCGQWWQRHVVEGFPPPPDGSRATTELLAHLWDVRPEAVAEVEAARAIDLRARHADLKARAKALARELTEVENTMRFETGENEIAKVGSTIAWTNKQNGTFRSKDFHAEQPELAAQYTRQVDAVDTERLAADHPDIYRQYRARRLYVPAKGL